MFQNAYVPFGVPAISNKLPVELQNVGINIRYPLQVAMTNAKIIDGNFDARVSQHHEIFIIDDGAHWPRALFADLNDPSTQVSLLSS